MTPICPRCRSERTEEMAKSPAGDVWRQHLCHHCFFSWRSTEPATVTDPDRYDTRFRLSAEQMARFAQVPPVPPQAVAKPKKVR